MEKIIIILIILIFIFGIFLLFKFKKNKKKLSKNKISEFNKLLKKIDVNSFNNKEKIIDFDKLYHKILKEIGYEGSFGSILKLNPQEIQDINKIWKLHKLRNKLAHDFDILEESILNKKSIDYKKQIELLIKYLT